MIFETIKIQNLFSYREATFDFGMPDEGKNLVLISGRNGYGKTSFINCVKLLFVGPNEEIRSAVQQGLTLKPKDYVLGKSDDWLGIINRRARTAGYKEGHIEVFWRDADDSRVRVKREWSIDRTGYSESLRVELLNQGKTLSQEQSQEYLDQRLPEDYLSFLFFDGEQIQRLAETNRLKQQHHMERLLNISPIDTLGDYLNKVRKELRRDAAVGQERLQLTRLEGELDQMNAELDSIAEQHSDLELERENLGNEIQRDDAFLQRHQVAHQDRDLQQLGRQRKDLKRELEEQQGQIAQELPVAAPLLLNQHLLNKALLELREKLNSETHQQVDALTEVLEDLPVDVFDKPPYSSPKLTDVQVRFYKHRLETLLRAHIPEPDVLSDGVLNMDLESTRELHSIFDYYLQANAERENFARTLKRISDKKRQLAEITDKLDDIRNVPEEEREEYHQRKAKSKEHMGRRAVIKEELDSLDKEMIELRRLAGKKQQEISRQERQVNLSAGARRKVERAEQLRSFFQAYKAELKKQKREAVETAINDHFNLLMTSHSMIRHIRVDDDFGLHFIDENADFVAMAGLAAGMKQLVATALLWALKEVAGKNVPLVIDTPLARMDRAHQENLLQRYYPEAGKQVIVLPTDSELDKQKYFLLLPHVYREFRLENPKGDDTEVTECPMYELSSVEALAHG